MKKYLQLRQVKGQQLLWLFFLAKVKILIPVERYGVPLGPLAISSLAFLFKNKNARISHENLKRVWNLLVIKNARLENATLSQEMPMCNMKAIAVNVEKLLTRFKFSKGIPNS